MTKEKIKEYETVERTKVQEVTDYETVEHEKEITVCDLCNEECTEYMDVMTNIDIEYPDGKRLAHRIPDNLNYINYPSRIDDEHRKRVVKSLQEEFNEWIRGVDVTCEEKRHLCRNCMDLMGFDSDVSTNDNVNIDEHEQIHRQYEGKITWPTLLSDIIGGFCIAGLSSMLLGIALQSDSLWLSGIVLVVVTGLILILKPVDRT